MPRQGKENQLNMANTIVYQIHKIRKNDKCNIVSHRDIYLIFIEESIDCFQGDWSALRIQSAIYETRLFIVCI